jgi:hypothetical protein
MATMGIDLRTKYKT